MTQLTKHQALADPARPLFWYLLWLLVWAVGFGVLAIGLAGCSYRPVPCPRGAEAPCKMARTGAL